MHVGFEGWHGRTKGEKVMGIGSLLQVQLPQCLALHYLVPHVVLYAPQWFSWAVMGW